ncbi:MAG: hypothetical protein ACYTBJ_26795 [Planctomycetota bacterium]|jgi:hypothetical protein
MADFTKEQIIDAVLEVTADTHWPQVQQLLLNEIRNAQSQALFLDSWDKVNEEKGFCRGLMYVMTLREQLENALKAEEDA